ncbi:MAG: T9SS type A sorting domain-containing protein [Candidatus Marinimicrobia bacterium]|nr:T9SS type A sorting domain-containing protein [Candidatus Neomarinimicrobiota bacterium]
MKDKLLLYVIKIIAVIGLIPLFSHGMGIDWLVQDADVWQREQKVWGKLDTLVSSQGEITGNNGKITFNVDPEDSTFEAQVKLSEGENWFVAAINSQGVEIYSDTLNFLLKLPVKPVLEAYPTVAGRAVTLQSRIIENPDSEEVDYIWEEDQHNPLHLGLNKATGTSVSIDIPKEVPAGEYYFDLRGITSDGDTTRARTFITVTEDSIQSFDIRHEHAAWIDSAVIYEITPYSFVMDGRFPDITNKLPELRELGVNTVWIQPVYRTKWGEHGYDVTDYFEIRKDYGNEKELKILIETAHSLGMRVLFDIILNHTSIYHPYAQHTIQYGTNSHYYNYYQREEISAPYSQYYSYYKGFINYFWNELPNLNYENPAVRNWMRTACRYWVEEFDIDGYRFDAIWGVNSRRPEFTQNLRLALKRIKPELMLLAEDKASWPMVFDERFDVAYDWAPDQSWVSQWYWATDYADWRSNDQYTIFNTGDPQKRVDRLREAITNRGHGYAENAKILRYMGNNDMLPFLRNHGFARTKMVAALVFSLNGIPLIYNGQEIGHEDHPYMTYQIFRREISIRSQDDLGLYPYYQKLIRLRRKYSAMRSENFKEINVSPDQNAYAFHRWKEDQNLFGVVNIMSKSKSITLDLPISELELDSTSDYYLTDLIGGRVFSGKPRQLDNVNMAIPGYTTCLFLLADSTVEVGSEPAAKLAIPDQFELFQNYPNPFNSITTISYVLPRSGKVELTILDVLGQKVNTLVDREQIAGRHQMNFKADQLASGCYFYRLKYKGRTLIKKMLLLK